MTFLQVTAVPCNQQGVTNQQTPKVNLVLHKDLIGAIYGQEIYLKGGNILHVGGRFFTNIRLNQMIDFNVV